MKRHRTVPCPPDVDAVNINALLSGKTGTFTQLMRSYYNNNVSTRYTSFQINAFGSTDKETIRTAVDQYVQGGWMLLDDNKRREITEVERNALRDAFVNFIVNENVGK